MGCPPVIAGLGIWAGIAVVFVDLLYHFLSMVSKIKCKSYLISIPYRDFNFLVEMKEIQPTSDALGLHMNCKKISMIYEQYSDYGSIAS